jgi:ATP-binding cassette, subfamily A (ABC1), member 3
VRASHVIFNMGFVKQTWTLTSKNLLIALRRHFLATFIRAFALPVGYMIFLTFARNLFISNDNFGVGTGEPVRTLAQGFAAADSTRNNLVFVNSGLRYIALIPIICVLIADKTQRR